jgi:hypothetical protein
MANVTQQPPPGLLFAERFAAYESSYLRIRPHRGAMAEIVKPVAAELEPLGFEDWHL